MKPPQVSKLGSKLTISASRVAAKIARRAGEERRAYRPYGRALRRTRRRFSPQPERTRAVQPLALLFVAHDRIDHIAPHASPAAEIPSVAATQIMSFDPGPRPCPTLRREPANALRYLPDRSIQSPTAMSMWSARRCISRIDW